MSVDLESLSEATSGAVGALVSTTVLYPLDTCKAKFQAELRAHGQRRYRNLSDVFFEAISRGRFLSLYQGLGTKNLQSFISQFVYFYGYSYFKRLYLETTGYRSIGTRANLIIAAAAGACTAIATQPLDTASSRMQTSAFGKSKSLWKTLTEGNWTDAFDGLGISLLLTSNPAIQYTVFDQLKQRMLKNQLDKSGKGSSPESLSAFSAFLLGALSKSIATVLTYPAIRCKVMIQAAETTDEVDKKALLDEKPKRKPRKTVSNVLHAIWTNEGIPGFFKGLEAQILKTVLSSALLLMIKEKISATAWVLVLALRRILVLFYENVTQLEQSPHGNSQQLITTIQPTGNVIKIDGSFWKNSMHATAAWTITSGIGESVLGRNARHFHASTALQAEAMACLYGVEEAVRIGISSITVLTDGTLLQKAINVQRV